MKETKVKIEAEIMNGKFCRNGDEFCRFYWESEDGDYGCAITRNTDFLEGDMEQMPKLQDCPNPFR